MHDTLLSLCASPPKRINGYWYIVWVTCGVACDKLASYPEEVQVLLAASCYRNQSLLARFKISLMMTMFTLVFWFSLYIKVNLTYVSQIEEKGMKFVARDVEGERMEIMEIPGRLIKINYTPQGCALEVQDFMVRNLWAPSNVS